MAPIFDVGRMFGWAFKRDDPTPEPVSFAPRESDDGAATIAATGAFGVFIDLDGTIRSEVELISRYRAMEQVHNIDIAVDEIVGEVINCDPGDDVQIILDDLEDQPAKVRDEVEQAFTECTDLLDFRNNGYQIFKRWYIDGRIYFHVIIDNDNPKDGIQEMRYLDPRKIRKIREVIKKPIQGPTQAGPAEAVVTQTKNEYYVFSDKGFNLGTPRPLTTAYPISGIKIAKDAMVHITSGLVDAAGTMSLSYLHKAIKPLNMFSTLKDASVINRLVRAPERRVWYVDVGDMSSKRAEQYVRDIMTKHRTRLNYDATTGEIRDDRKFMTMLEDFWIPRKSTGQGTKVDVLPPGANFAQIDDILFFERELYQSLHVPVNRINQDDMFQGPVATEITRDELKFGKFVERLRMRFNKLFLSMLEKQLVLKQVMSLEDFEKIRTKIRFQYSKDNEFKEAKEKQVENMRVQLATLYAPFIGKTHSWEWLRKKVFMQTDEDIEEIDMQIAEESVNPQFQQMPEEGQGQDGEQGPQDPMMGMDGGAGVLIDPAAMQPPDPNMMPNQKGPGASTSGQKGKKPQKKKPNGFKSVANLLGKSQKPK